MNSANGELAPLKVSTHELPERDRLPLWQDFFAQKIVLANVELLSTDPLRAEATLQVLPGARAMWLDVSTHLRMERGPAHVSNGDDSFSILVKESGLFSMSQRGLEISLDDGEALAITHTEPARLISSDACNTTFTVPHNALAPFVKNIKDTAMRYSEGSRGAAPAHAICSNAEGKGSPHDAGIEPSGSNASSRLNRHGAWPNAGRRGYR